MMGWNYRVIRHTDPDGDDHFAIHEVHYNKNGKPDLCTEAPVGFVADSPEKLREIIGLMVMRAFDEPVLDYESFKWH